MLPSTHVRLTRTSSDLRLLAATLCPPSPILTSDNLVSPSMSGEIPLIIDLVVDELSAPFDSPLPFKYDREILVYTREPRQNELDIIDAPGRIVEPPTPVSSNFSSCVSSHSINESLLDEAYFTPTSSPTSQSLNLTSFPFPLCDSRFRLTHTRNSNSVSSSSSNSSSLGTVLDSTKQVWIFDSETTCNVSAATTGRAEDEENENENETHPVSQGTSATFSTLPTLCFALPSPSSSADVISPTPQTCSIKHHKPLERSGAIHQPKMLRSIPRSPRLLLHTRGPHDRESSDIDSEHTTHWQLIDFPSVGSTYSWASISTLFKSPTTYPYLPDHLSWLQGTEIELWIDQEGFRAIRPMMRLMGYSPRSRSLLPYSERSISTDSTGGVAEFMPVKRESFAFHHATPDGPPMLRRVTVGGDESHDYLSRHATLHMKTNGVYTVLGSESTALGSQDAKTQWKFDYLVDDHYVDGSGRILSGKKIITPLTFSCSPFLLHPLQGRKVGFMHFMKKSVVPKLAAEKLQPPENVGPPSQGLQMTGRGRTGMHRPSQSAVHADPRSVRVSAGGALVGGSPLGPSNGGIIVEGTGLMQYTRRRRASSAGEHACVFDKLTSPSPGTCS